MNQLKKQIQVLKSTNEQLREKIKNYDTKLADTEVFKLQDTIDTLLDEVSRYGCDNNNLRNALKDKDKRVDILQNEVVALANSYHNIELKLQEEKDTRRRIRDRLYDAFEEDTESDDEISSDESEECQGGSISAKYNISDCESAESIHKSLIDIAQS